MGDRILDVGEGKGRGMGWTADGKTGFEAAPQVFEEIRPFVN